MPRRVQQPTTPAVRTTTPSRPTQPRQPAATQQTSQAWGTQAGGRAQKKSALAALTGSLHTPAMRPLGNAPVASTIAGVPVQRATTHQFTGLQGSNELQTRTVDVSFGKLSKPQFDALKAEFGGKSTVPYDANREYGAVDFLPAQLQALVNKDLDTGAFVKLPGTERLAEDLMMGEQVSIGATPNCHGTAWEMMRAYQGATGSHVQLAYGDAQLVGERYTDAAQFSTVASAKPGEKLDTSKLQPGDVVSFSRHSPEYGDMELLHSAVYVGGGLFFEKPDTEADEYTETPYRLVTLEQVTAPISEFLGEQPSTTARRPTATLQAPAEAFASGKEDVAKLESILNKRGETIGRQLTTELIMGMGGGVRGMAFNAVTTHRVETDATGRGVIR